MTTLWDQFTQALTWLQSPSLAGVRTITRTEVMTSPATLGIAVSATVAPPTTAIQGVDVAGFEEVTLPYVQTTPESGATTVLLWAFDGARWSPLRVAYLAGGAGRITGVRVEGYLRIAYSVLANSIQAASFSLYVTPHN